MSHAPDTEDDRDPSRLRAEQAAFDRRAAALRANLKRRKAQLRGRASDQAAPDAKPDGSDDEPA